MAYGSNVTTSTMAELCTASYVQSVLPFGAASGLAISAAAVTASPVYNYSVTGQLMYPDATFDYCDVTFTYSHTGKNDSYIVNYWMPAPGSFQNRYLSTGGGGLAINSGAASLAGGLAYGAVAGQTDGGFGSLSTQFDAAFLYAEGVINYDALYAFGYTAHHELSIIGKAFTRNYFSLENSTKLYAYYQGCSEGGREGWSQVQRFGDEWDGAVIGAPAFRYSFQQVNHLTSNVVEQTLDYYPPPCELAKIVSATITACDALDGKTDGVVSRTDLCKLHFNIDSLIGQAYSCAASGGSSTKKTRRQFPSTGSTPAQNGTISKQGVEVAKTIIEGLKNTNGEQVYFSYQPTADFDDAQTAYNSSTQSWGLSISGLGGEWVAKFLQLTTASTLSSLDNVTYDTLAEWMVQGLNMYSDSLQTDWPDLTPFHSAGGKVLHYHGESDFSIPPASSVRYWDAVRKVMYPAMSYNQSVNALNDWYRLYLVPGAGHCSTSSGQPNGPWPQTNLAVMIDWVENGVKPSTLNATHLAGSSVGKNAQLCAWPLRPLWAANGTVMRCVYDKASLDTWMYDLKGVKLPVY